MFKQTVFGSPMKCLNRNCKHPFSKKSHLGYCIKNEFEVYTIMRCLKCKDTFEITQPYSLIEEYKNKLPQDTINQIPSSLITSKEIDKVRKRLSDESVNVLESLYEGFKPGTGHILNEDQSE